MQEEKVDGRRQVRRRLPHSERELMRRAREQMEYDQRHRNGVSLSYDEIREIYGDQTRDSEVE